MFGVHKAAGVSAGALLVLKAMRDLYRGRVPASAAAAPATPPRMADPQGDRALSDAELAALRAELGRELERVARGRSR